MKRRLIALSLFLVMLGLLYAVFHRFASVEEMVAYESRLRGYVDRYPVLSLVGGLIAYVLMSLIPGTGGKAIIAGWLFGFWGGLVVVNVGLTIAALITFYAVRYLFQDIVHERFSGLIRRVDQALQEDGPLYLLTLRLLHAPYTLTNYASGATMVEARTFWWTTQVGMLPGSIVFVLAGSQLPTLQEVIDQHPLRLVNVPMLIAVTLVALLPVGIRWLLRSNARTRGLVEGEQHQDHSPDGGGSGQ